MKIGMNISIKQRIYWSFALLVCLFVLNGIITILTINSNKKLSRHLSEVVDPSLQAMEDFENILVESKMYTTNWVFLRTSGEDKKLLRNLHDSGYSTLKSSFNSFSSQWKNKNWVDSLNRVFTGFEQLLAIEKDIMNSLKEFKDYDDPVIKLEAERTVEEEILPRTTALMNSLNAIHTFGQGIKAKENAELDRSSMKLRWFIIVLAVFIMFAGLLLSIYMTRVIVRPLNKIRRIINNLGQGIIEKIDNKYSSNEIGKMIYSVNNLSQKLQITATFAQEIGLRNFDMPFKPLSEEDTLGKALIMMRDNIKSSDEKINQAQHIAHLGSWERNIKTDRLTLSDEIFAIFDIDPLLFDFQFQSIVKLIHPDDIEYTMGMIRKNHALAPVPFECRIVTSKGIVKNVIIETQLILGRDGEIEKTLGIVQDITGRKKAEEQIKLSNERYELVIKTTNDMIWDWDLVNNTIFRNENYSKVFGTDAGDRNEMGKWTKHVHPEDKDNIEKAILQRAEDPDAESWEAEFRYYRHNNEMVYLHDRALIIRDENKKAIRMVGATSDITERKKAELQLRKSEERYRQIVETAQEGIWLIDENNYTIFVNRKMCEMLEYSPEEIMGKQNYDFKDDEEKKRAAEQIGRRKQGLSETNDAKFVTKSGKTVWTRVSTNPVFDDAGIYKGALAMVTDITKRKADEELLYQSEINLAIKNKELESKNKELEQFAYVASHDMQEPLRTTSSFVELLQQQYRGRLDEKADKYLSFISQSSDRMKVLIKDLLDYSRIGRKKELARVDCNRVLAEVIADLDLAIKETQAVITAEALPVIDGYPTEIKQLFQNLLINAIKFRKKTMAPQIKISVKKIKDNWEFSFKDNGIGMDEQHGERIFIIFQRLHTRTEYEGSGIGLAHCKKIVELHNGKIWFNSKPGEGTTFYFIIPQNNS